MEGIIHFRLEGSDGFRLEGIIHFRLEGRITLLHGGSFGLEKSAFCLNRLICLNRIVGLNQRHFRLRKNLVGLEGRITQRRRVALNRALDELTILLCERTRSNHYTSLRTNEHTDIAHHRLNLLILLCYLGIEKSE